MTATISAVSGAGTTQPITVLSPYEVAYRSRNVIHDLIGGGIAVSIVAPNPRAGNLALLYGSEEEAQAAALLHLQETGFTLTDTETPSVGMTYVVDGEVTVALDQDTLTQWVVTVGFQETPGGAVL
jgi:hypothetical protein